MILKMKRFASMILVVVTIVVVTNVFSAGNGFPVRNGADAAGNAESYIMTYLYGGLSVTYTNYLEKTKGALSAVSPDYFTLAKDGSLLVSKMDGAFIGQLHAKGMKVIPFLSNNWDKPSGVAGLQNAAALSTQIANSVYANNLDGVDVDIQNVSHEYKDKYTDFVKMLREKMPDKHLSVAVAANPNGWTQGWHGSYDYAKLAQNCDYLMIMAYDESYSGSDPGPVASKSFVERSIQYALKYTTPDKLVLGMPFYGRYWKSGKGGNALTAKDVESLIRNYRATKTYDEVTQSAKVMVTIESNDVKPILWGGRTLDEGYYEIWYDDLTALQYKMSLAEKYNLRGLGSWALGQENTDLWDMFQPSPGTPVPNPSANPGVAQTTPVLQPSQTPKTTPKQPGATSVAPIPSNVVFPTPEAPVATPKGTPPFSDVADHWAIGSITKVKEQGWMQGMPGGMFVPNANLTRAEAVTIVMKAANMAEVSDLKDYYFRDTRTHWAKNDIAKARYYNFINGKGDDLFRPDDAISREEFATLMDKTFLLAKTVDFYHNPFTDMDATRWSYSSIIVLSENEIIMGYPDGTFRPEGKLTRAEAAEMLSKLIKYGIRMPENEEITEIQLPR